MLLWGSAESSRMPLLNIFITVLEKKKKSIESIDTLPTKPEDW